MEERWRKGWIACEKDRERERKTLKNRASSASTKQSSRAKEAEMYQRERNNKQIFFLLFFFRIVSVNLVIEG